MELWFFMIKGILSLFMVIIHVISTYLTIRRRFMQPIKSRSYGLVLIFALSLTLSTIILCAVIVASELPPYNASYLLFGILTSEIAFIPIVTLSYIFRYM